jgi:hypothetical protein
VELHDLSPGRLYVFIGPLHPGLLAYIGPQPACIQQVLTMTTGTISKVSPPSSAHCCSLPAAGNTCRERVGSYGVRPEISSPVHPVLGLELLEHPRPSALMLHTTQLHPTLHTLPVDAPLNTNQEHAPIC